MRWELRLLGAGPRSRGLSGCWFDKTWKLFWCRGTFEQATEPAIAHIGPCDKLATQSGVDPLYPPRDPERDKAFKKTRRDHQGSVKTSRILVLL